MSLVALFLAIILLAPGTIHAADYPRVLPVEQQNRDSDRARILADELQAARDRLADATAKRDAGAVTRHSADIASIEAELGKRAPAVLATARKVAAGLRDAFGGGMPDVFGSKGQD